MLTVNADTSVTATFNKIQRTLTVNKTGTGRGLITSVPPGINCGMDCTETYDSGTIVNLKFTAVGGSFFAGSSGGGCSGTGGCTLTINADTTVTATFSETSFTFTDDPLISKVTFVKAIHFLEPLDAINTLRQRDGLSSVSFTAPIPAAGVAVLATHLTTLQTGLNAVYDALGMARPAFDTIVAGVTAIGKSQIDQIRNAIRAVETVPTQ